MTFNLLHNKKGVWKHFITSFFTCHCILFCTAFFLSSTAFAAGTETTQPTEDYSNNNGKDTSHTDAVLEENFTTECLWLACDQTIALATRQETPISKAPGVITVIADEEIKNAGYRTFTDILRTVPGFEILKMGDWGYVTPAVRGLKNTQEGRIRLMINGHMVNNPATGEAFGLFDDFPVEFIKRVEIIRGPGSAVYGENAFSAVINIITKDADDINGLRMSSGYGSFDTYEENVLFGDTYGKVKCYGMARYKSTDGFNGKIKGDYQTTLDNTFGSHASLAPGRAHDGRQEFDLNMKATYGDLWLQGWYTNKNYQSFVGPSFALTDRAEMEINNVFGEIGYKKTFDERFTLKPRMYYDQYDNRPDSKHLPDGATLPNADGVLETHPNGLAVLMTGVARVVGAEIPLNYELFDGNTITLGLEYRLVSIDHGHTFTNYDPYTLEDWGSLRELQDHAIPAISRTTWSGYLQDVWDITDTLNLTLGARLDHYSDFGEVTSPRAGFTWAFMRNASLKLLYGEAFRPPSFNEAYVSGQAAIQGNKDLEPEVIKSYEAGISYQFNKHVTSAINYFYNDIADFIVLRPMESSLNTLRFENFGSAHVQGIELETKVDIVKDNYVFMNYTFQNPEDDDGNDMPFVAQHFGNFGVNVHYWKYINTNLSTFVSGKRSREEDDTRSDLPAYALLNLSVIGKEFFKTMEVQGTVYNLLDKDYSDPGPTSIPDDLPRPGRTFFVGLSYQF